LCSTRSHWRNLRPRMHRPATRIRAALARLLDDARPAQASRNRAPALIPAAPVICRSRRPPSCSGDLAATIISGDSAAISPTPTSNRPRARLRRRCRPPHVEGDRRGDNQQARSRPPPISRRRSTAASATSPPLPAVIMSAAIGREPIRAQAVNDPDGDAPSPQPPAFPSGSPA
jgi:hypothetical protein